MGRPRTPEPERFWPKVRKTDGCWFWTARVGDDGYGTFGSWIDGQCKNVKAHRWAWEQEHGPIPEGMTIDHLCNTKTCVRPSHMRVCTRQANQRRYYEEQTHCVNGHPREGIGPCRHCVADAMKRFRQRQKERGVADHRPNSRYRERVG